MRIGDTEETWNSEQHHRSRKNTKRWCKGKPGREHAFVWERSHRFADTNVYRCAACGKEADWCLGDLLTYKKCHCGTPHMKYNREKNLYEEITYGT